MKQALYLVETKKVKVKNKQIIKKTCFVKNHKYFGKRKFKQIFLNFAPTKR